MNFALGYLIGRFFYRIFEFLRHWYVRSGRIYSNFVINRLEHLDRFLAWRITLKNLFQPLYKDYTTIGYALGFLFRFLRVVLGSIVYVAAFAIAVAFYIAWLALPPYLLYRMIYP